MSTAGPDGDELSVVELGVDDLDRVLELCALAMADEPLVRDDLEAVRADPLPDGDPAAAATDVPLVRCAASRWWGVVQGDVLIGAALGSLTEVVGLRSAHLQLLVVHPARRRRGTATRLVAAFEAWALAHGVSEVAVGAGSPFYLFSGVDTRWTEALCCFEALGYRRAETELDLVCATAPPSTTRGDASPDGAAVQVGHVEHDRDAEALRVWVRQHYPHWEAELDRAAQQGTVLVARDESGALVGAAAHSVSRTGVIGPVAVQPGRQRSGVGAALMRAVLADLSAAGLRQAEIAWTSTVRFYAVACGARVGRSSVVLRKAVGPER